ncbi:MAG TPA: winged helix-turn-helix transcriptional regulator [Halococcus sp.]|nr:winged helix-turn-helix transcriptional regulator [Halococcus sp.]
MDDTESRTERWDTISFVISSNYRMLVLEQLAQAPEIPSRIDAEHEHVLIEHVSRALRELREQELVELLVPEEQEKRRLYGLTEQGERAWQRMHTANLV